MLGKIWEYTRAIFCIIAFFAVVGFLTHMIDGI